ncbi:flagellar basal body rod protein FlgG [Bacillus tuaregi]|uniref:flagellar basal body rod protein FlgG n=1 Tax=Bacillus tuaregi TaxID=1816695 RepID=UPI0008F7E9F6|nr:flagellar basal body rod protein FlgG [Bacillus tuaregi]
MLRSMYSGISGMKNFQTKLDVIGNNISNVNTYGFKKGRVTFQDLVSQSISGASAPSGDTGLGGVNPKQVGLGSQLSTIDTIDTQGSLQTTARTLDLAISGDGYFILARSYEPIDTENIEDIEDTIVAEDDLTEETYTRAGNFYLDSTGAIVNAEGRYLVGVSADSEIDGDTGVADEFLIPIRIPLNAKSFSIGNDGSVTYIDDAGELQAKGHIAIAKFSNNGGLEKVGSNNFQRSSNAGKPSIGVPGGKTGAGTLVSGALEMSNVDLSEEFTDMIVAQRGFQANTRIITTSDEILQELVNLKR